MDKEKQKLRDFLDEIGVHSGDDRGFVLIESLFSSTRMEVSRRYIESEPWKHLLDKNVFGTQGTTNMYGQECLMIILE